MKDLSFPRWVRQVFDHPVAGPEWYWDPEADASEPAPHRCVEYLTRLFEEPEEALGDYSDAQLNQGLWYLTDNSCSETMFGLIEPGVGWPERRRAIDAIAMLFERLFARRCSDHLSHLAEAGGNPLNLVCYMWWDIFPTCGRPEDPARAQTDARLLAVIRRISSLEAPACQESALHGLGHWHLHYPAAVERIVDDYLSRTKGLRPELRDYAERARRGCVQ